MRELTKIITISLLLVFLTGCAWLPITVDIPVARRMFNTSTVNPPHVLSAARYVGYDERSNRNEIREFTGIDPVQTEWCAAFVNAVLLENGIPGSDSVSDTPLLARSFLDWGAPVDEPQRGDIVVFARGNSNWQGHVAIYIGSVERNGRTYYRILGGNQNNGVNVGEYPATRLLGIRRVDNSPQRRIVLR